MTSDSDGSAGGNVYVWTDDTPTIRETKDATDTDHGRQQQGLRAFLEQQDQRAFWERQAQVEQEKIAYEVARAWAARARAWAATQHNTITCSGYINVGRVSAPDWVRPSGLGAAPGSRTDWVITPTLAIASAAQTQTPPGEPEGAGPQQPVLLAAEKPWHKAGLNGPLPVAMPRFTALLDGRACSCELSLRAVAEADRRALALLTALLHQAPRPGPCEMAPNISLWLEQHPTLAALFTITPLDLDGGPS